ncbi:MAG: methyltransferase [Vicinamibacteraceae bacterium]
MATSWRRCRRADAYVLVSILHDWDDDRCVVILPRCQVVMQDHENCWTSSLSCQTEMSPSSEWLDLHMLVMGPSDVNGPP